LGPVFSQIASSLTPSAFLKLMTDPEQNATVPRLVFVELMLDDLAADPVHGSDDNLPYANIDHLRDCLVLLKQEPEKLRKTVLRSVQGNLSYRTCINGFFVGSGEELRFYRYPSLEELNEQHHVWWRSAISVMLRE
jgi:hypothetical protein